MEAVKNHSNLRITPHLMYSPQHRYGQKALIPGFHIQLMSFWSGICVVFEFYFLEVVISADHDVISPNLIYEIRVTAEPALQSLPTQPAPPCGPAHEIKPRRTRGLQPLRTGPATLQCSHNGFICPCLPAPPPGPTDQHVAPFACRHLSRMSTLPPTSLPESLIVS
jgi:hypothetical protein